MGLVPKFFSLFFFRLRDDGNVLVTGLLKANGFKTVLVLTNQYLQFYLRNAWKDKSIYKEGRNVQHLTEKNFK